MKPSNDREAVTIILTRLSEQGFTFPMVQDDTWDNDPNNNVRPKDVQEAVDTVMGVDEAFVYVNFPGTVAVDNESDAHIYFVLGNSPEEVVCDHSVSLSPHLDPITKPWW
jgi:hypothetical protein